MIQRCKRFIEANLEILAVRGVDAYGLSTVRVCVGDGSGYHFVSLELNSIKELHKFLGEFLESPGE